MENLLMLENEIEVMQNNLKPVFIEIEKPIFKGSGQKGKRKVTFKNQPFFVENKKLGLSIKTQFDWGYICSNSINLSQAILLYVSNDSFVSLAYYNEFLRDFLISNSDNFELKLEDIESWLLEKRTEHIKNNNDTIDEIAAILPTQGIFPYEDFDIEKDELDVREIAISPKEIAIRMSQGTIITDPDFQRNVVWKIEQKSRFIESIILNIPIPPIYLNESKDGKYIMIDGLQRSTSVKEFLDFSLQTYSVGEDGFRLQGLKSLKHLNGKKITDLSPNLQMRIMDKKINCHIIKPSVPMSVVYDIFYRINTGGTQLTTQEIRNCIYIGPSTVLLSHLASNEHFKSATDYGLSPTRMKDKEVVLRYLAFQIFDYKQYSGNIDDFLGKTMQHVNTLGVNNIIDFHSQDIFLNKNNEEYKQKLIDALINIQKIKELINDFERVMRLTNEFFGKSNFRCPINGKRGRINVAVLESVSYFFALNDEEILIKNRQKIQHNFEKLIADQDYLDTVRLSTGDKASVVKRFEKAIDILGSF